MAICSESDFAPTGCVATAQRSNPGKNAIDGRKKFFIKSEGKGRRIEFESKVTPGRQHTSKVQSETTATLQHSNLDSHNNAALAGFPFRGLARTPKSITG